MLQIDILTIFPELFGPFLDTAFVGMARRDGAARIEAHDLRHLVKIHQSRASKLIKLARMTLIGQYIGSHLANIPGVDHCCFCDTEW